MIEDIFRRRAELLAKPLDTALHTDRVPVLFFSLGSAEFGIEIASLAEVFPYRGCTAVPGGPAPLAGVLNVRGDIRPVVDLARLLDVETTDATRGYIVMARAHGFFAALRIDAVSGIRHVEASRVNGASGARPSRFIKALMDDTVRLVDMNTVFAALGMAAV